MKALSGNTRRMATQAPYPACHRLPAYSACRRTPYPISLTAYAPLVLSVFPCGPA
ncbi:hypothetical protein KCP70_13370 [Salmonella enterica subsp. enterica]|nr:hypothetical protein KCP70_13370 [Salmonella enterica subsp. enterica]